MIQFNSNIFLVCWEGFFVDDRPCARLSNRNLEFKSTLIEYPYTTHTISLSAPHSRCHVAWLDACLFEIRRQLGMAAQWASAGHQRDGEREWGREGEREGEKTGCHLRQRADSRKERGGDGEQQERRVFTSSKSLQVCVCVLLCARLVTCVGVCAWKRDREKTGEETERERDEWFHTNKVQSGGTDSLLTSAPV